MLALLKEYRYYALLGVVLLGVGIWALFHFSEPAAPAAPPLSPAQQEATEKQVATDQKQVGRDTTRAAAAAASGATSYQAGNACAEVGKVLHQQSKLHAKPTPGDTAAARLQKLLSGY